MAHGRGAISLSAETEMELHRLAHQSERRVIEKRYEELTTMKAQAHSMVLSEDPTDAIEPDVLSIHGTNHLYLAQPPEPRRKIAP